MRPDYAVVITCNPARMAQFMETWATLAPTPPLLVHAVEPDEDGIRGCWQSHLDVLTDAPPESILAVFEDDAVFQSFSFEVNVPDDWDILYYGGASAERDESFEPVVDVGLCHNTQGYVARDPHSLAELLGPPQYQVHVDWALGQALDIVRYAVNPPTVGQRGGVPSDINAYVRPRDEYFVNQHARNNLRLGRPQDADEVRDLSRDLANQDHRVFQFLSEEQKNRYRDKAREILRRDRERI